VIAIPFAANPGPVAAIAGRTASPRCNQSGHEPPMIAIPATGYGGSLHIMPQPSGNVYQGVVPTQAQGAMAKGGAAVRAGEAAVGTPPLVPLSPASEFGYSTVASC
jgi:hypothetical protein